eukprot:c16422_g1_i1.p1 GENE.c16422_g1_i1~~c16422_g1_i1.p1  ORF type:complete len:288 (-),score=94.30 c16422_g1_i1:78-911(-)
MKLSILVTLLFFSCVYIFSTQGNECFFNPPPTPQDTLHPCNSKLCQVDEFNSNCSRLVTRFCFETSQGISSGACRRYAGTCSSLFNKPQNSISIIPNYYSSNSTRFNKTRNFERRFFSWWPCGSDECKDIFSAECMRSMLYYCTDPSHSAEEGCKLVKYLCQFPKNANNSDWICENSYCLEDMRSAECLDAFKNECVKPENSKVFFCSIYHHKEEKENKTKDELSMTQKWLLGLASPNAADSYNSNILSKRYENNQSNNQNNEQNKVPPPPLYPSNM